MNTPPKCPKCGTSAHVKLIDEHEDRQLFDAPNTRRFGKIQAFQCQCGWAMARSVPPNGQPTNGDQSEPDQKVAHPELSTAVPGPHTTQSQAAREAG